LKAAITASTTRSGKSWFSRMIHPTGCERVSSFASAAGIPRSKAQQKLAQAGIRFEGSCFLNHLQPVVCRSFSEAVRPLAYASTIWPLADLNVFRRFAGAASWDYKGADIYTTT